MVNIIQLLTVENIIRPLKQGGQQSLIFHIKVVNLSYEKQVDVVWCGKDGEWRTLKAEFLHENADNQEYWLAKTRLKSKHIDRLPGDIRFALRLRCQDREFWDNNRQANFLSHANSGLQLNNAYLLLDISFIQKLDLEQQWLTVKIAVNASFKAAKVILHWSADSWRHIHHSPCRRQAKLSNQHAEIWTARIKIASAFRVCYALSAENRTQTIWDNNDGLNYTLSRTPLKVMILNLHCRQEEQQDDKFTLIAKAIDEQMADVVCLQEVSEFWNEGRGDWPSNAANIINQRLRQPFYLYTDWSHLGFDQYREGVAILSRFPLLNTQARYVSESHDAYSIHSRKVVMAQIHAPYMGNVNVYSVHLSWWEDGFSQQFIQLHEWVGSLSGGSDATMLCGDFNISAGSPGYWQVVNTHQYDDQYSVVNARNSPPGRHRVNDAHWRRSTADDGRIDYIFMPKNSPLQATYARILFTDADYGRVSDHVGFIMTFEPK
ncbi:MAG: endonuclease/exonuclease/phosphatase family protein [Methylomonas sp.]|jgi:maltose 6'-phosphate phosphatase